MFFVKAIRNHVVTFASLAAVAALAIGCAVPAGENEENAGQTAQPLLASPVPTGTVTLVGDTTQPTIGSEPTYTVNILRNSACYKGGAPFDQGQCADGTSTSDYLHPLTPWCSDKKKKCTDGGGTFQYLN